MCGLSLMSRLGGFLCFFVVGVALPGCWPNVVEDPVGEGPAHCSNHRRDADETDIDCGGSDCRGCFGSEQCVVDSDCATGFCDGEVCSYLRSCAELQAQTAAIDGVVWVDFDGGDPGAPVRVYCDQSDDGGGWMLALKVSPARDYAVPERRADLTMGFNPNLLLDTAMIEDAGLASHGTVALGAALQPTQPWARFTFVAGGDRAQTVTWFKEIASPQSLARWFVDDDTRSPVCPQANKSTRCRSGSIASDGVATWLYGFSMADLGFDASGDLSLHLEGVAGDDGDEGMLSDRDTTLGGVCTRVVGDGPWSEQAPEGCGNGMMVWIR